MKWNLLSSCDCRLDDSGCEDPCLNSLVQNLDAPVLAVPSPVGNSNLGGIRDRLEPKTAVLLQDRQRHTDKPIEFMILDSTGEHSPVGKMRNAWVLSQMAASVSFMTG